MYEYRAKIIRVVDGDTVDAEVDLGFHVRLTMKLRLYGINAPELSTDAGKDARAALKEIEGKSATITTLKDKTEKYGRYLAVIDVDGVNWNDRMVASGFAKPYYGVGASKA